MSGPRVEPFDMWESTGAQVVRLIYGCFAELEDHVYAHECVSSLHNDKHLLF